MADAKEPFDPKSYLPAVAGYYTDIKGNMLSFPFNSSTVVLYVNKDAFKKAGLNPDQPPKTWKELNAAALQLKVRGQDCVYTTGWPAWMHIENFSAWHNVPIGTKENGMGGLDTEFTINSPLHVRHLTMLGDMSKKGLFTYAGRTNQAEAKFASGECAMLTSSTGAQANFRQNAKFDWSVNFMPYHDDVKGAPQNSIIGGASLWVMGGKKPDEYKGVAKFFAFLSKPEIQMEWHTGTGYVPITMAAYELTQKSGFYDKNPGADVAIKELTNKPPTANSKGLRFGNYVQGREVIEEEMEAVFSGQEGRQDGARRRREARQRHPAQVRGRQQVASQGLRPARRPTSRPSTDGKARPLPFGVAAVRAARAADRDHDRLLLLARRAGDLVLVPAPGRVRPEDGVRRAAQLRRSVQRQPLSRLLQGHGAVQRARRRLRHRHLADARRRWRTAWCAGRSRTRRC